MVDKKSSTYDVTHKNPQPQQKNFFSSANYKTCHVFWYFNQVRNPYRSGDIPAQSHVRSSCFLWTAWINPEIKVLKLGSLMWRKITNCKLLYKYVKKTIPLKIHSTFHQQTCQSWFNKILNIVYTHPNVFENFEMIFLPGYFKHRVIRFHIFQCLTTKNTL